jgi:hypothetical protein
MHCRRCLQEVGDRHQGVLPRPSGNGGCCRLLLLLLVVVVVMVV